MPRYEGGRKAESKKFYACFVDHQGVERRIPLFEDRKASEEAGSKLGRLVDLRAANDTLPADLTRWIETTTPFIRAKLAGFGIIGTTKLALSKKLAEHVEDWKKALLAKGNTARHAELVSRRARKAFEGCGFTFWTDISASRIQAGLATLREDRKCGDKVTRGVSAQTYNFYLQAVKQFCRWMVRDGRGSESPLMHLQGLNVKTDRRHDRRALSVDELCRVLDSANAGPERFGMAGAERALLYRLAVETGLRTGEIRSLTRASFVLDGDEPSVTIAAAYAKNRRADTLPLRPITAQALASHLLNKLPAAAAFNVPVRTEFVRMWRADLADARAAWIKEAATEDRKEREQSDFLAYEDGAGRFADAHSLRHTFVSNLVAGGVHPKTAQRLARHGTIGLTMDRYTHSFSGDLTSALAVLPHLPLPDSQKALATGTDGNVAAAAVPVGVWVKGSVRAKSSDKATPGKDAATAAKNLKNPGELTGFGLTIHLRRSSGGVPERPNGPVLKTGRPDDEPLLTPAVTTEAGGCVPVGVRITLQNHPELAALIDAWPALPEAVRAGILAFAGVKNGAGG